MLADLDARTLRILEHRRRTGWAAAAAGSSAAPSSLADVVGLLAALLVAQVVATGEGPSARSGAASRRCSSSPRCPLWVVGAKLYGLYDRDEERTDHTTVDDLAGVFHLVTVGAWLFLAGAWLTDLAEPDLVEARRLLGARDRPRHGSRGPPRARTAGEPSRTSRTRSSSAPTTSASSPRGRSCGTPSTASTSSASWTPTPHDLPPGARSTSPCSGVRTSSSSRCRLFDVERVLIAFASDPNEETLDLVRVLNDRDVQVDVVPRLFELVCSNAGIHTVEGLPLVGLPPLRLSPSSRLLKRALDVARLGRSASCCSCRSSPSSPSRSSSTPAARSSSARCGWAPATGRSASPSSGRWRRTRTSAARSSRT